jgi:hypothetical protein
VGTDTGHRAYAIDCQGLSYLAPFTIADLVGLNTVLLGELGIVRYAPHWLNNLINHCQTHTLLYSFILQSEPSTCLPPNLVESIPLHFRHFVKLPLGDLIQSSGLRASVHQAQVERNAAQSVVRCYLIYPFFSACLILNVWVSKQTTVSVEHSDS